MYQLYLAYIIFLCLKNGDNTESEIEDRETAAPYIVDTGSAMQDYILVIENLIYLDIDDLLQAVAAVVGLYYNIAYPEQWNNCHLLNEKLLWGYILVPILVLSRQGSFEIQRNCLKQ